METSDRHQEINSWYRGVAFPLNDGSGREAVAKRCLTETQQSIVLLASISGDTVDSIVKLPAEPAIQENIGRFERARTILRHLNNEGVSQISQLLGSGIDSGRTVLVGEEDVKIEERPYSVFKFIQGRPINHDEIRSTSEDFVKAAFDIASKICAIMTKVHDLGVIHRDLKPGNILIDDMREVTIIDFGVAYMADTKFETAAAMPRPGIGTAGYASPEQRNGEPPAPCHDVFSIGCVLLYLLTGHEPSANDRMEDLQHQVLKRLFDSSRIPERLYRACLQASENKAEDRFSSPLDFAMAIASKDGGIPAPELPPPTPDTHYFGRSTPKYQRVLAGLLMLALLSFAGVWFWGNGFQFGDEKGGGDRGGDNPIIIVDPEPPTPPDTLVYQGPVPVWGVAASNNHLISCDKQSILRIWPLTGEGGIPFEARPEELSAFESDPCWDCALTTDGNLAAVSGGKQVVLVDLKNAEVVDRKNFDFTTKQVAFSADNSLLAIAGEGKVAVLSQNRMTDGDMKYELDQTIEARDVVSFDRKGSLYTTVVRPNVTWDVLKYDASELRTPAATFEFFKEQIYGLDVSESGLIGAAGAKGLLGFKLGNGDDLGSIDIGETQAWCIDLLERDESTFAAVGDGEGNVHVLRVTPKIELISTLERQHKWFVRTVQWLQIEGETLIVSGGEDGKVVIHQLGEVNQLIARQN